ncbi:hypothetical protein LWC05_03240 [Acetobacter sicerae]|uniref:Uncharacterized protein n=1 Tax=Acetobacter sicerae TaxID=85325 RepID=A0ABS8VSZ9_9PROT|nr:hypothetical protein [Acetobacter sicerae]MCE0742906.1 hypothetical protein [Acetobacter sicerae]
MLTRDLAETIAQHGLIPMESDNVLRRCNELRKTQSIPSKQIGRGITAAHDLTDQGAAMLCTMIYLDAAGFYLKSLSLVREPLLYAFGDTMGKITVALKSGKTVTLKLSYRSSNSYHAKIYVGETDLHPPSGEVGKLLETMTDEVLSIEIPIGRILQPLLHLMKED